MDVTKYMRSETAHLKWDQVIRFSDLEGQRILDVMVTEDKERVFIETENGLFVMCHTQDCCESVYLEDVSGDILRLCGETVTRAEESSNDTIPPKGGYGPDSYTWTFYRITAGHYTVVFRWYGESNGYYSESVDTYFIPKGECA